MQEILNDPLIHNFLTDFASGEINLATGLVWLAFASVLGIIGGAIGGVAIAGKELGNRLAAMIGGLFGPTAVIPATIIGLAYVGLR